MASIPELVPYNSVYTQEQEELVRKEFSRTRGQYYLDHAGATLYSEKQISSTFSDFSTNLYANPHARSSPSKLTEDAVDQIRYMILQHFATTPDQYSIIFTSSATQALKLVAESFFSEERENEQIFAYLEDNHTSVLGMREYCKNILPLDVEEAINLFSEQQMNNRLEDLNLNDKNPNSLFVYPAQSNFSGFKYPLEWLNKLHVLNNHNKARKSNWYSLLDAASYVSTNNLDLSKWKPDFVPISFYKIFGFPTGLGALLVKNSSSSILKKKYFGGGTVLMALSSENVTFRRKALHENFEDGSLPFLSILSLKHGFDTLTRLKLNIDIISIHTFELARYFYQNLVQLKHGNGNPIAIIYSGTKFTNQCTQGAIVNFNLLRPNGDYVGYAEVLHFANLNNISLRTGCFCNPGACKYFLKLTNADIRSQFDQGHVCGDSNDLINGYPTGSVRISFGYMSTKEDADAMLQMICNCFLISSKEIKTPSSSLEKSSSNTSNTIRGTLDQVLIYPVKSCAPFTIETYWNLTPTGLQYDREWMIINSAGVAITQKRNTYLCLIKPVINLKTQKLELHFDGLPKIELPLESNQNDSDYKFVDLCQSKVCNDRIQGFDCGQKVSDWLSDALNTPGLRLLRQCSSEEYNSRTSKQGDHLNLSLANQAQFLLINTASVQWLKEQIPQESDFHQSEDLQSLILRFRPNLIVNFKEPFVEKTLKKFWLDEVEFEFDGNCTRCQMICIDQKTGEKSVEPLRTLSTEFGGKITFGVYFRHIHQKGNQLIKTSKHPIYGLSTSM